ncbi:MAG TPA: RNA polymerase sigma factor [Chitinophagaceae bacterium]|nr:RNA polymerase sigma factor [Chitinophagaceae bacterium]
MNPFCDDYRHEEDIVLVKAATQGSRSALEMLLKRHQRFLYNLALKLVRDPHDAADLTQEVLIKVVTKLAQFEGRSHFRTWLYRIAVNHFRAMKRTHSEAEVHSFESFGSFLSETYTSDDFTLTEMEAYEAQITATRNMCMTSMLLCLDRQQRIVFILGAIFKVKSTAAARILEISPESFRQQLTRAKKELFQFMDNQCGLINPENPCRCSKKTKGFMQEGKVDMGTGSFKGEVLQQIRSQVEVKNEKLTELMEGKYLQFFRRQPYEKSVTGDHLVRSLILDPAIMQLFQLN